MRGLRKGVMLRRRAPVTGHLVAGLPERVGAGAGRCVIAERAGLASAERDGAERVAYVGEGLAVAGVVELVGQENGPAALCG